MNRIKGSFVLGAQVLALFFLAFLLLTAAPLFARQAATSPVIQQEVPDNPMHPAGPVQPIPYSHKTHLALGLTCDFCHTNPEPGKLMTYPATSICMSCHTSIATDKPAIQKLAAFAQSQQPIPWVRVYTVLPGVNWAHRVHLQAGMKCEMCHGQVAQMQVMSEATSVVTMYSCLRCHEQNNAKSACSTCHPWPKS